MIDLNMAFEMRDYLARDEKSAIKHHKAFDRSTWMFAYFYGYRPPMHSMPAIRVRVNIFKDVVIIWDHHTNRAVLVCLKRKKT